MELYTKHLSELLTVISWQKIFQTTVLILVCMASWIMWENRNVLYNTIRISATMETSTPLIIRVSTKTKEFIDSSVNVANGSVSGIQIVNVDFRKNTRSTAYFHYVSKVLKEDSERYISNKLVDTPLFNDSEINNQRLINLINGEFVCTDFDNTMAATIFPNASRDVEIVCSVSIPPYYGRFSGYMNVYLSRQPTPTDLIYIKQLSRDISLRVFEIDINVPPVLSPPLK